MKLKKTKLNLITFAPIIAIALIMIISATICIGVFFLKIGIKKTYTSEGILCVQTSQIRENEEDYLDPTYKSILNTAKYALESRSFCKKVSEEMGGKYTFEEIQNMTTIKVEGTELIKISIKADNPTDAYLVAEAFVKSSPEYLEQMMGPKVKVYVVESPVVPIKAS